MLVRLKNISICAWFMVQFVMEMLILLNSDFPKLNYYIILLQDMLLPSFLWKI